MKLRKSTWAIAVLVFSIPTCIVITWVAHLHHGESLQQRRTRNAEETMARYHPEDWSAFYRGCLSLYEVAPPSNTAIDRKHWPPPLRTLDPDHVWFDSDRVVMNWKRGFSEPDLYVYVYRQDGQLPEGDRHRAGVHVVDARNQLPEWPHVREDETRSASARLLAPPAR